MSTHAVSSLFYQHLLDLRTAKPLKPHLVRALELAVEVTGARLGYLELWDATCEPRWWIGHGVAAEELETIQRRISRGIIGRAIAEQVPIRIPSALTDERFRDLKSVKQNEIHAVLCAPVLGDDLVIGVIYLQGRSGGFEERDVEDVQRFAVALSNVVGAIVPRTTKALPIQVDDYKAQLVREAYQRNDFNAAATARELQVARKVIYGSLKRR
jgi:signal transduction protein with GAF and PtsI domain